MPLRSGIGETLILDPVQSRVALPAADPPDNQASYSIAVRIAYATRPVAPLSY